MKIAPNKKDISDFFVTWGWLGIVFVLFSYLIWYWPITAIDAIKSTERINFFIESYGLQDNTLQQDLLAQLQDDGVLEVNIYDYSPSDASLTNYYDSFGTTSDFLVLNDNDVATMFQDPDGTNVLSSFVPFSSALRQEAMSEDDYSYYTVKGCFYALKIFDAGDASYNAIHPFGKLIDFTKDGKTPLSYYLLLNANTPNLYPYNPSASTGNGLKALKYFLSLYH